jgi:hypothetical protein
MPYLAAGVLVHPFTHIVDIVVNDEKLLAPRDLRLNLGIQPAGGHDKQGLAVQKIALDASQGPRCRK